MFLASLTFDDGYLDHIVIARYLSALGVRATFFVITHLREFEGKPLLSQYEEFIAELAELGHEVGSHTCTHKVLTELPQKDLDQELRESKRYLEDVLGREVKGLAYPYGFYNIRVIRTATKYYEYARATDILPSDDPLNTELKLNPIKRYIIGSAGLRSIGKVFLYAFNPKFHQCIKPVVFMHRVSVGEVLMLAHLLKLLGAKFVTLKDLVSS